LRFAGAAALVTTLCVLATPAQGQASEVRVLDDAESWLEALGDSWHRFDNPTRADVAHVWGLLGFQQGLSHLRGCVEDGLDVTGACHVALMSLQDVESVPLFRKTLRHSDHPIAVGSAALGLSAFGDDFSRDLVLKALLEGRGTWRATDALVGAFKSMPGPWRGMYLAFASRVLDDPMSSARVVAAAWPPSGSRDTPVVVDALDRFLTWWWDQEEPGADVHATATQVLAKVTVDHEGCVTADRIIRRLIAVHPYERGHHVRNALSGLTESCFTRKSAAWIAAMGSHLEATVFAVEYSETPDEFSQSVVWWKVTVQLVGQGAGLSLTEEATEALALRLAAVESVLELETGQWDVFAARKLLVGAPSWIPANHAELERRAKEHVYPEDFYGYNSFLQQPAWYPSRVHITIDDGPRLPYLPGILDTLERYRVRATFFFVGAALARRWLARPDKTRGILDRVRARGHGMAFHSMNHETIPSLHMREWEPEQVADSVDLYRLVIDKVAGVHVPITHGRLPGGMGFKWPWVKASFYQAGLHEHVHWNAGPPTWIGATQTQAVREQACGLAHRGKPTVVLLHEYKALAQHLGAFLHTVREQCPVKMDAEMPSRTTAHWGTK